MVDCLADCDVIASQQRQWTCSMSLHLSRSWFFCIGTELKEKYRSSLCASMCWSALCRNEAHAQSCWWLKGLIFYSVSIQVLKMEQHGAIIYWKNKNVIQNMKTAWGSVKNSFGHPKILFLVAYKKGLYFDETSSLDCTREHVRASVQHLTNAWGVPKLFSNCSQFQLPTKTVLASC